MEHYIEYMYVHGTVVYCTVLEKWRGICKFTEKKAGIWASNPNWEENPSKSDTQAVVVSWRGIICSEMRQEPTDAYNGEHTDLKRSKIRRTVDKSIFIRRPNVSKMEATDSFISNCIFNPSFYGLFCILWAYMAQYSTILYPILQLKYIQLNLSYSLITLFFYLKLTLSS